MLHILGRASAAFALLFMLSAQAAPDLAAPMPVDPELRTGRLDNGLSYYIRRNATPANRIEMRLAVKAGSVLEDEDQQGLAHFVEHMAFNGSTHFKRQELVSFLQSIGVQLGADLNAYTAPDETVYMLSLPSSQPRNLERAYTVLEDWAHGVRFDPADVEKERPILLEEMNMRVDADERIERQLRPRIYNGARYALRQPLGKAEILRHAPAAAISRFYRDWYRPDLMAVVVVGDIDPVEAERQVKRHFAALTNPSPARVREDVAIPLDPHDDALVASDLEATGSRIAVRYALQPAGAEERIGDSRSRMIGRMLGSLITERINGSVHAPDQPFAWANGGIEYLNPRTQNFFVQAQLNEHGALEALPVLLRAVAQARQFGFTAPELERERRRVLRSYESMNNNSTRWQSGAYAAEYLRNFLTGESLPSRELEARLAAELLADITVDDLNAALRAAVPIDGPRLVIYRGMEGKAKPDAKQLLAGLAAADRTPIAAYDGNAAARTLLDKPPTPGRVVARSEDATLGLTRLTLSNGIKVILKPTDFQNDQVLLGGIRDGGIAQFALSELPSARYMDAVVGAMGVGDMSPYDMGRNLAGVYASLGTNETVYADTVNGWAGASRRDLETMLQFLWLRFTRLHRDKSLFDKYIGDVERNAANALASPGRQVEAAIYEALFRGQPYAPIIETPAKVGMVDLDRSLELYKRHFASAAGFTFVVVGSFKLDEMIPLLETYLGSLPTPPRAAPPRDVGIRFARGVVQREVSSGDQGGVRILFSGKAREYSEAEDRRIGALADIMNLRIVDVLRAKLGLVYAGSVTKNLERLPFPVYTLDVSLPTSPEHVAQVKAAILSEIERMKKDGPLEAELDKVKLAWIEGYRQSIRQNGYWLNRLLDASFDRSDPADILRYERIVRAMTRTEIRDAARRYFDLKDYVQVVVTPATTPASPGSAAARTAAVQ